MDVNPTTVCTVLLVITCLAIIGRTPKACSYILTAVAGIILFHELSPLVFNNTPASEGGEGADDVRRDDRIVASRRAAHSEIVSTIPTIKVNETDDGAIQSMTTLEKAAPVSTNPDVSPSPVVFSGADVQSTHDEQLARWKETHKCMPHPHHTQISKSIDAFQLDHERDYNMMHSDEYLVYDDEE